LWKGDGWYGVIGPPVSEYVKRYWIGVGWRLSERAMGETGEDITRYQPPSSTRKLHLLPVVVDFLLMEIRSLKPATSHDTTSFSVMPSYFRFGAEKTLTVTSVASVSCYPLS